jgi:hypothetical protein
MFKFQHEGKNYHVWFKHYCHQNPQGGNAMTVASLICEENGVLLHVKEGESHCSKKDQFSRTTGRRVALAHLLGSWYGTKENKEARRSIWLEYAKHHKDGHPILTHNSQAEKGNN